MLLSLPGVPETVNRGLKWAESRVLEDTRKMLGPAALQFATVSQALGVLADGSRPEVLPFSGDDGQDEPVMKHPGSLAHTLRKC